MLGYLHIWGCPIVVKIYNPHIKKLDFIILSDFFIDYAINSKEYKFYYPSHTLRIIKANAKSLEDLELNRSGFSQI